MEDFVAYIIKNLVSKPEEVTVSSSDDQEQICIEIRVAADDVGKVIGRRGNTINALRTIVRTVATRLGRKAQVELIQPDQSTHVVMQENPDELAVEEEPALT
jgi:predicted RNA-binding protein YlqC (UPF0109 family)